jgi:lysozyme family protein
MESYRMGKCRHHTLAFPDIAKENAARIEEIRARRKAAAQAKKAKPKPWARSSSDPGESSFEKERIGFKPYMV